jgi:hypothetical protein
MKQLINILPQIDDPVAAHRSAALQALSNLVIDDPETKQTMSKKENIKKVIARVCDPELDVRVAAVGTLRYTRNGDGKKGGEGKG